MSSTNVKSGLFLDARKKLQELNSGLLMSSADFINASLWLIAGNCIPQALVMLHNAIEVALKGELERIHRILIADTKELQKFESLKSLLKDAFKNYPSVKIAEFDIERTIYFEDAFTRVAELYPDLSNKWRELLVSKNKKSLHSLRNDIVHDGGNTKSIGSYIKAIIDIGFPFMEDFYGKVSNNEVKFAYLVKDWIYREMDVARSVLKDLEDDPQPYVIKTLQHQMLWTHAGWPSPPL